MLHRVTVTAHNAPPDTNTSITCKLYIIALCVEREHARHYYLGSQFENVQFALSGHRPGLVSDVCNANILRAWAKSLESGSRAALQTARACRGQWMEQWRNTGHRAWRAANCLPVMENRNHALLPSPNALPAKYVLIWKLNEMQLHSSVWLFFA